jgi:glutathione peroxidase
MDNYNNNIYFFRLKSIIILTIIYHLSSIIYHLPSHIISVRFHLYEKIDVNGPNQIKLFKYLKTYFDDETDKGGIYNVDYNNNGQSSGDIEWNFEKFLVGSNGIPIKRYRTKVNPLSFENDILEVLRTYDGMVLDINFDKPLQ